MIVFSPSGNQEMKWDEMKCWECEGVRLTEPRRVVSSIPSMPAHTEPHINSVSVYSQCKTPRAQTSAKSTAPALHKYTPVTFINFRHLRTATPANKNSSNPLASQQRQAKMNNVFEASERKKSGRNMSHPHDALVWVVEDVFNFFYLVIFLSPFLHITFKEPLENRPLRCLHKALAWKLGAFAKAALALLFTHSMQR